MEGSFCQEFPVGRDASFIWIVFAKSVAYKTIKRPVGGLHPFLVYISLVLLPPTRRYHVPNHYSGDILSVPARRGANHRDVGI